MNSKRNLLLAVIATMALAVSGCTAETSETPAPATTGTQAQQQSEPGSLPFETGDIDVAEFTALVQKAMEGAKTITIELSDGNGSNQSTTQIDQASKSSYTVAEAAGVKLETVAKDDKVYLRTDGGAWEEQTGLDAAEVTEDPTSLFATVELVDPATRTFKVGIKMGESNLPAEVVLDEQNRIASQKLSVDLGNGTTTEAVSVYSYDQPVEIPSVS